MSHFDFLSAMIEGCQAMCIVRNVENARYNGYMLEKFETPFLLDESGLDYYQSIKVK